MALLPLRSVPTGGAASGIIEDRRRSDEDRWHQQACESLAKEANAIAELSARIDERFTEAVRLLLRTEGHVVVIGIGKSGLVGRKIAATFASTGTPSFFLHAAEAFHGDLGAVTDRDTVVLISYSGETQEVLRLVPHFRRRSIRVIALVGDPQSSLATLSDVALNVAVSAEVCPLNLAPTSSSLATLAMGDALAVVLMRERRFRAEDFARFHPGGTLGRRLARTVGDVMQIDPLPTVIASTTLGDCLLVMASGKLGLAVVVDDGKHPLGVVTHEDLAKALRKDGPTVLSRPVASWARNLPGMVESDIELDAAELRMDELDTDVLIVVGHDGRLEGVVERATCLEG